MFVTHIKKKIQLITTLVKSENFEQNCSTRMEEDQHLRNARKQHKKQLPSDQDPNSKRDRRGYFLCLTYTKRNPYLNLDPNLTVGAFFILLPCIPYSRAGELFGPAGHIGSSGELAQAGQQPALPPCCNSLEPSYPAAPPQHCQQCTAPVPTPASSWPQWTSQNLCTQTQPSSPCACSGLSTHVEQ